ncbi:uncharacterized protein CLUP02_03836 [Colletotrichum lupini]|uniref:Uncharacterized protein n=1 Tax=Colletotrichum lupini TaxID=145971 RepID=A0A9Q8SJB0_9PEZI|nr:uncharacterized protein CLUP02_03836 [Colletotrichum lupini]UQC78359.1 hypothetical protein CLUP02_03836 [Colletotrichum lupini]
MVGRRGGEDTGVIICIIATTKQLKETTLTLKSLDALSLLFFPLPLVGSPHELQMTFGKRQRNTARAPSQLIPKTFSDLNQLIAISRSSTAANDSGWLLPRSYCAALPLLGSPPPHPAAFQSGAAWEIGSVGPLNLKRTGIEHPLSRQGACALGLIHSRELTVALRSTWEVGKENHRQLATTSTSSLRCSLHHQQPGKTPRTIGEHLGFGRQAQKHQNGESGGRSPDHHRPSQAPFLGAKQEGKIQ